ncbi:MAG TPA: T9SS type A sorting domain-containing protein [Flavobacterium sp.]|nr:T9SS type A sorting domain-containing protein [Flavobacterium sp.]
MKKITLIFFAFLSTTIGFAQGLETFDNATDLPGNGYSDGSFVGNDGITWEYTESRDEGQYSITGEGIMLRNNNESGNLTTTIQGGIGNFSVDTRKAFTGGGARGLELYINGTLIEEFTLNFEPDTDETIYPFEVTDINTEGEFTLEIRATGAQITLDNIEWTGYSEETPCDITAPTGDAEQTLDEGQTLADLIIEGEDGAAFTWYADGDLTEEIGADTEVEDGTTYYVVQTIGDCTSEALAITVTFTTSANNFDRQAFKVYPNPVKDILTIAYKENISEVTVINMLGQTVISKSVNANETQLDMSALAKGNYLLKVNANSAVHTVKISK